MAAHVSRVRMRNRHVNRAAETADFFGRRHDGSRFIHQFAHAVSARLMPQRRVLQFAILANNRRLAVTDNRVRSNHNRHQALRHGNAHWFQLFHERHDVFDVASRIGILRNGRDIAFELRRFRGRAEFMQDLFDMHDEFPYLHQVAEIALRPGFHSHFRIAHQSSPRYCNQGGRCFKIFICRYPLATGLYIIGMFIRRFVIPVERYPKSECHRRPNIGRGLDFKIPALTFHQVFGDGKPQPDGLCRRCHIVFSMMKRFCHIRQFGFGDPDPNVTSLYQHKLSGPFRIDENFRSVRRVFYGVSENVRQTLDR